MTQPLGFTAWIPVILAILLTGGTIAAIVLIPVSILDDAVGDCNNTVLAFNVTGTYTSVISCSGVNQLGPYTEGPTTRTLYIKHDLTYDTVMATDNTTDYQGYIISGGNLQGAREMGFYDDQGPTYSTGRFEAWRRCTANKTTEVSLLMMGQRIVTGETCLARRRNSCPKFTKTCTERLTRTSKNYPPGTFTAAPTPVPI